MVYYFSISSVKVRYGYVRSHINLKITPISYHTVHVCLGFWGKVPEHKVSNISASFEIHTPLGAVVSSLGKSYFCF